MSQSIANTRLKVDLLPRGPYKGIAVVVDVLRATTSVPLLLQRGVAGLYLTPSLRSARNFAREHGYLLVGERDGLPPEGFNHGASPTDLARQDWQGKTVVMTTQNGPRTLPLVQMAERVLLASFYNARAVASACLALAPLHGREIAIVCAGHEGGESLEDTLAAGFLARRIERAFAKAGPAGSLELRDAARLAMALLRAYPDPQEALYESQAGHLLRGLNLHEDIAFASLISQTEVVPVLCEVVAWEPAPLYRFEALVLPVVNP
jgi:2-phosphosulfolactate phosphatase